MPEYEFEETKLRCPKCEKGKVRLVISRKEGKEYKFFRCSEYDCDWNGGFYNQDNNKIDIIDNCPSCDGILYVRNGKKGPFLGCSHFPKCKQTRDASGDFLVDLIHHILSAGSLHDHLFPQDITGFEEIPHQCRINHVLDFMRLCL